MLNDSKNITMFIWSTIQKSQDIFAPDDKVKTAVVKSYLKVSGITAIIYRQKLLKVS